MTALRVTPRLVAVGAALAVLALMLDAWIGWVNGPLVFDYPPRIMLIFIVSELAALAAGLVLGASTVMTCRARTMSWFSSVVLGLFCATVVAGITLYTKTVVGHAVMLVAKSFS